MMFTKITSPIESVEIAQNMSQTIKYEFAT